MAARGKPRTKDSASGRHDQTREQSFSFWAPIWRAGFEAKTPQERQEYAAYIRSLLRTAPPGSEIRAYAAACGIAEEGDGDECVDK